MKQMVNWNGHITSLEEACLPVFDHAYLYGDGLFEGIRIYNRNIFKLDPHLERLYDGIRHLDIRGMIAYTNLKERILETAEASGAENAYIRVSVSRGTGIGLNPENIDQTPNVMIAITRLALYPPEMYETGLRVVTVSLRVMPSDSLDPRIKSIGRYVANIQAKTEANRRGAGEGLMLNQQGYVAEATGDNLFIVKDGVLRTPHPSCGILKGITRATVIEIAKDLGVPVVEDWLTLHDVYTADEAFLTGTAAEIIPMTELDHRPIGDGKPGVITEQIIAEFRQRVREIGVRIGASVR
ncbi:MAG: branched chain amino acid aminotransferase [Fimbriimonadales bacterium]|nr:MAG: branched chain amino acid aminotransferase [Fimbriimonadales bacterium]